MPKDMDSGTASIPIVPAKFVAASNGTQLGELFAGGRLTQWDGTGWVSWEHVQDYLEEYSARAFNMLTYLEDVALTMTGQLNMQVVCTAVQPTAPAPAPAPEPTTRKTKGKKAEAETQPAAVAQPATAFAPAPAPAPTQVDVVAQAAAAASAAMASLGLLPASAPAPVPTPPTTPAPAPAPVMPPAPAPAPVQPTLPGIVPDIDTAISTLCATHGLNAVGVGLVRHLEKSAGALDQAGLTQLAKDFRITAAAIRGTITFNIPA